MDDDKLRDILYRHVTAARDMGQGLANDIVSRLNSFDEELSDLIAARYAKIEIDGFDKGPATTKRLEDMKRAYAEVNSKAYRNAAAGLTGNLEKIAGVEAKFAANAVKSAGGIVDISNTIPSANFLKTLITTTPLPFSDDGETLLMPWLAVQEEGRLRRLEGSLLMSAGLGESTGQAVRRIMGTKANAYADGILQTSRRDATTIALTANSGIQNAARTATYKGMKSILYLEWSAILDGRTSVICQGRSGTIYPIDGPHPTPPAHPRCRSILIPRRDNEGTKHKPYGDWLKDQPEAVQDEVLGKARADVFRKNPNFDFAGYFKEGGGYKTLGELREFDARLFNEGGVKSPTKAKPKAPEPKAPEKAPTPVAEAPKRFETPINPAITDATVPVMPRTKASKALTARVADGASNAAYEAVPEFKSVKAEMFGKAQIGAAFSDEAASTLVALWPELDALADAFAIPRLRAIKTISSKSAIATMGDGVLSVNPVHFNGFASKVGLAETGGESAALIKARAQQVEMKADIDRMSAKLTAMRAELNDLGTDITNRPRRFEIAAEQRILVLEYRKIADREFKMRQYIRTLEYQGGAEPVSTWKAGDDIAKRPYTVDKYVSGIDKARSILFHEFGHHVHQMTKKDGRRYIGGRIKNDPPVERKLSTMFYAKFHTLGVGFENKNRLSSTYAGTNEKEWFAESFAAFMLGRKDLADPDLIKYIQELLDDAAR